MQKSKPHLFCCLGFTSRYGIGLDTIVAENSAARFGGFKAWGQSRTGGTYPHTKQACAQQSPAVVFLAGFGPVH